MKSLVLELQQEAMNPSTMVSDLLRKALVVATKLNIKEFREWVEQELHGYKGDVETIPVYRHIVGELKAIHPMYGLVPAIIGNPKLERKLRTLPNNQPIGEIEHLVQSAGPNDTLQAPLDSDIGRRLNPESFSLGIVPTRVIGTSKLRGVLDAVRNIVLEWSLKLESDGILGGGMTFSREEKEKATSNTYNIENFTGVLGTVHAVNLQIGDYNSIHAELKKLGIAQADRSKLEDIMDRVEVAKGDEKKSLVQEGLAWVVEHAAQLGALAEMLKTWFQSQGGG